MPEDSHPLALQIREAQQLGATITTIKLGNLQPEAVLSLVTEAMKMEGKEHKVEKLASNVHKKTAGNPYYVLMFLTSSKYCCVFVFH